LASATPPLFSTPSPKLSNKEHDKDEPDEDEPDEDEVGNE
jgi:hypothetical protein